MTLGKSRQLTLVFLAVLVPAAVTLVWLGLRLLEQDRILFVQREAERREAAVDVVVRTLTRFMDDVEQRITEGQPSAGTVLFSETPDGMTLTPQSSAASDYSSTSQMLTVLHRFQKDSRRQTLHWSDPSHGRTTIVLRPVDGTSRAMVIPQRTLTHWLTSAAEAASLDPASLSLLDSSYRSMAGARVEFGAGLVRRERNQTGLPWVVASVPGIGAPMSAAVSSRQRMFAAGFAVLGLFLVGGAFLLWRVVQRELALGRLQAEFVAAVSHEFRTPVTSLRHVTELLQEDDDLPGEQRARFYAVLSRGVERLSHLVESLLDFARMEEGRKAYDLKPVDPAMLVSNVVGDFMADQASRDHAVTLTVAPGTPKGIRADAAALGHALWNLLDNAVKYSPDGDAVSVAVEPHQAGVVIAVTDAGIGIPRDERRDVFEKFVRGKQASRLGIRGTGVGLAIVAHIARAHGGSIACDSIPGQGSTFRLMLPNSL